MKILSGNDDTFAGIILLPSPQPSNALSPMVVRLAGSEIVARLVHPLKVLLAMVVKSVQLLPNTTVVRAVLPVKALAIEVILEELNVTLVSPVHPLNIASVIEEIAQEPSVTLVSVVIPL